VSAVETIVMIVWVVVVVMGVMPIAIMLTWADRRLGSMIQDRVGPNRAVVWLPTKIAQGGAVAPALGAAGLVALLTAGYKVGIGEEPLGVDRANSAIVYSQLGILLLWVTFAVIAGVVRARGPRASFDLWIHQFSPRSIVYLGFGVHFAALIVHLGTAGTELGTTVVDVGYGGGAALLMFACACSASRTRSWPTASRRRGRKTSFPRMPIGCSTASRRSSRSSRRSPSSR
jgi:hypothetical protein